MLSGFCPASFGVRFCSVVLGCQYTHLKRLNRSVSGAWFLTEGVFECDIAHLRSVAIQCMLCKIRCNPVHPLNGALPGPYVSVWITRGALVAHRFTYAPPRSRTSQYLRTFILLSVSLWNDLANPVFDGVGLAGFKSSANAFFNGINCTVPTIVFCYFIFSSFWRQVVIVGHWSSD